MNNKEKRERERERNLWRFMYLRSNLNVPICVPPTPQNQRVAPACLCCATRLGGSTSSGRSFQCTGGGASSDDTPSTCSRWIPGVKNSTVRASPLVWSYSWITR